MHRMSLYLFIFVLVSFLVLSCSPEVTGPVIYERIVIDSYPPSGAGDPETDLILYDETGTELGSGDHTTVGGRIDTYAEGLSLSSGTYYIKVYNKNTTLTSIGYYAVRVLSLTVVDSVPDPDIATDLVHPDLYEDDDNAPGNIPTDPVDISLGNSNWVSRYLGEYDPDNDPDDDDWLRLVLP